MKITNTVAAGIAVVAVAIASVAAFEMSRGAFTEQTTNPTNTLDAGAVALSDNDAGSAQFSVTDWLPGAANRLESCIEVAYDGTLTPADVRLFVGPGDIAGGLPDFIDVNLDRGTGAAGFGDCAGFALVENVFDGELGTFAATHTSFATGAGTWSPAAQGEKQHYRFALTLQNDPGAAAETVAVIFTWEARNQ